MEVYSEVSSASAALPTLHTYPLVTGPCSFPSHLNFPGSIQPGSYKFWRLELITHTHTHTHMHTSLSALPRKLTKASLVLPGTYFTPGSRESTRVDELPGQEYNFNAVHSTAQPATRTCMPSLACKSRTLSPSHSAPRILSKLNTATHWVTECRKHVPDGLLCLVWKEMVAR